MNNTDIIMLECSCGIIFPVSRTYLCRHCLKFRCSVCSEHDIFSYYCECCDNSFSSASKKIEQFDEGKCSTCYDCPYCFNHLTLRMKRKNKNTSSEDVSYYLTCSFCLWSTHDIDFPDQKNIASFRTSTKKERISSLISYHRAISWNQSESTYKDFCVGDTLVSKFSISQKTTKLRTNTVSLLAHNLPVNIPCAKSSEAEENSDVLPDSIFSSSVDLSNVTNMCQRLAIPSAQPMNLNDLTPLCKQFKTKKLLRCLQCSHNLSVPEIKAGNSFKVNQNCLYFVPTLKVVQFDPLRYDSISQIIFEVVNCFPYNISVSFLQNFDSPKCILKTSLKKNVDVIILPKIPVLLPPKLKNQSSNGRVRVRFLVQPNILASINDDSIFSFVMQYTYVNKDLQIPEITRLDCKIFVNLGKFTVL